MYLEFFLFTMSVSYLDSTINWERSLSDFVGAVRYLENIYCSSFVRFGCEKGYDPF